MVPSLFHECFYITSGISLTHIEPESDSDIGGSTIIP